MSKKSVKASVLNKKLLAATLLLGLSMVTACSSSGNDETTMEYDTVEVPTQGVVTNIEETSDGKFLIAEETIIDNPDSSKAVVSYLDGTKEIIPASQIDSSSNNQRRGGSMLQSILMFSLLRNFMGGGMSSGFQPNASAYKNESAYNKSAGINNQVRQSTSTRTVARPSSSRSGFGSSSSRSTRSYGG
jgi:hypothetical protein